MGVTRALGTNSRGCTNGSMVEWGRKHGEMLKTLGADIAGVSGTQIPTLDQTTKAAEGFKQLGCNAIGHNVYTGDRCFDPLGPDSLAHDS